MKKVNWEKGFTLIELLLVVVIIGLMLSVIVPRAWRANIDAKYGLVRQNCSELASYGQEWAESQILAQNEQYSSATLDNYFATLTGTSALAAGFSWVADPAGNWTGGPSVNVTGRIINLSTATEEPPEASVDQLIAPEKVIRNPFNEVNIFMTSNLPAGTQSIPGSIACDGIADTTTGAGDEWRYYAFLYQGTDSTTNTSGAATTFYAGQLNTTLAGLRNGIFFARVRPGI